jgi:hypothetical protein
MIKAIVGQQSKLTQIICFNGIFLWESAISKPRASDSDGLIGNTPTQGPPLPPHMTPPVPLFSKIQTEDEIRVKICGKVN